MPVPIVDVHSHIFNAEDLPIDGFLKRLSPAPALLTGVLSVPLDRLSSWAAPGSGEGSHLVNRLCAAVGLESVGEGVVAETDLELISDEELDRRLVELWPLADPAVPSGLEGPMDVEEVLAERISAAPPEHVEELEYWLREWGDPELDEVLAQEASGQEGIGDVLARAAALRRAVKRFIDALRLITKHRYRIASELAQTYPDVSLFVPALVDFSHATRDDPATSIPEQISIHSQVSKLSVVGGIPYAADVRIHPLVGFSPEREIAKSELHDWDVDAGSPNRYVPYADPAAATEEDRFRPGLPFVRSRAKALSTPVGPWCSARLEIRHVTRSLDLVRHAIELGGFAGVKLYPPSGFLPIDNVGRFGEKRGHRLDAALRALYGYCEAEEVPILTHAARSNGFEPGYDDLAAPTGWARVLEDYPTLRVCFGHFGHLDGVGNDPRQPSPTSWPRRFLDLVDKYPNVYADVGNSKYAIKPDYKANYDTFLATVLGPVGSTDPVVVKRCKRLMFGSDYWMNTLSPDHSRYFEVFSSGVEQLLGTAVREAFLGGNALRWLGITGDDDLPNVPNLNRGRLVEFYGNRARPDWLAG